MKIGSRTDAGRRTGHVSQAATGPRTDRGIDESLIDSQVRRTVAERIVLNDRAIEQALSLRKAVGDRHA
mgnify:CR=1 FL=1